MSPILLTFAACSALIGAGYYTNRATFIVVGIGGLIALNLLLDVLERPRK